MFYTNVPILLSLLLVGSFLFSFTNLTHVLHKGPNSPVPSMLLIGSAVDGVPSALFSCHFVLFPDSLARSFPFSSISQEKLIAKDVVAWRLGCFLHMLNLFLMLLIPILVINVKSDYIGVLGATVVTLTYSILFLKLWSYVQVAEK